MQNNIFHIIKDPVHGVMQFTTEEDNWIKPFISSANFQRQRNIKQLGLTDWIFPGAVHTRFNHGLGCCYIASQIVNKLGLSRSERQLVILACLLHDIGHGPFSHTFEDVFFQRAIQHEMWTPMFLEDFASVDFLTKFNTLNPQSKLDQTKINKIQNLIMHRESDNYLLSDIVSSQLDADRLDYLLRDSHFCGVTYGEYDFRWLLHCLIPIEQNGVKRLGITHKGVGVVEQYLMARRLMIRNVYQNGKKHGVEYLLKEFLHHLANDVAHQEKFLKLEGYNSLVHFLQNVNHFNQHANKTKNLEPVVNSFLHENYKLYKELCDYDILAMIRYLAGLDSDHATILLAKRLQHRILPKILYVHEKHVKHADAIVKEFKQHNRKAIDDWQIALLKLPHLSYAVNKDPILVRDFSGTANYLHDNSMMISAISDKYESAYLVVIDAEIINRTQVVDLIERLRREIK
ncbi:MAG: HD domain-containing protein [Gammaproteobacteria bacterium]